MGIQVKVFFKQFAVSNSAAGNDPGGCFFGGFYDFCVVADPGFLYRCFSWRPFNGITCSREE